MYLPGHKLDISDISVDPVQNNWKILTTNNFNFTIYQAQCQHVYQVYWTCHERPPALRDQMFPWLLYTGFFTRDDTANDLIGDLWTSLASENGHSPGGHRENCYSTDAP